MSDDQVRSRNPDGTFADANDVPRKRATAILKQRRATLDGLADEVVNLLMVAARAGDVIAAGKLLDKMVPSLRPAAAAVEMPGLMSADRTEQIDSIRAAMATGEITSDVALDLMSTLAKANEIADFEAVKAKLDELLGKKP